MASSFLQQRIKERDQRRSGDVSADSNAPSAFLQQRIEDRDRRRAAGEGYHAPVQRITFPEKKGQADTQAQQEAYIKEYQRQTGSKTEDKFNGWKYSRNRPSRRRMSRSTGGWRGLIWTTTAQR